MRSVFIGLTLIFIMAGLPAPVAGIDLSIEDYSRALERAPDDYKYKYYLYRGRAYSRSKNYALAIEDFSASLANSDRGIDGYIERGKAFLHSKMFGSAALDFGRALAINPNNSELYRYRAEAFAGYGRFDLAISDANQLVALKSGNPDSLAFLADMYVRKGDYKAAKAICEEALLLDFDNNYALRVKQAAFAHEPEIIVFGNRSKESSKPTAAASHGRHVPAASDRQATASAPATAATPAQPRGIREFIQAARSVGKQ